MPFRILFLLPAYESNNKKPNQEPQNHSKISTKHPLKNPRETKQRKSHFIQAMIQHRLNKQGLDVADEGDDF